MSSLCFGLDVFCLSEAGVPEFNSTAAPVIKRQGFRTKKELSDASLPPSPSVERTPCWDGVGGRNTASISGGNSWEFPPAQLNSRNGLGVLNIQYCSSKWLVAADY
jgi:hypothetical protein